jgi:hypothetical protein
MASLPSGSNTQRRAQGQQAQRLHPGRDVTGPWWRCPDAPEQGRVRFKGAFTKKISGKETNTNTKNYQSWSEIIKTSRKQIWAFDDGWSPRMTRLLVDLGSYWDKEGVAVCWGTRYPAAITPQKHSHKDWPSGCLNEVRIIWNHQLEVSGLVQQACRKASPTLAEELV